MFRNKIISNIIFALNGTKIYMYLVFLAYVWVVLKH